MLTDFLEPFLRMRRALIPDGMGGSAQRWEDGDPFLGGVTFVPGGEVEVAGLTALRVVPVLVHEPGVTLWQDERVRRLSDGAVFRVAGCSDDMRTPGRAGVGFAQVRVEEVVCA